MCSFTPSFSVSMNPLSVRSETLSVYVLSFHPYVPCRSFGLSDLILPRHPPSDTTSIVPGRVQHEHTCNTALVTRTGLYSSVTSQSSSPYHTGLNIKLSKKRLMIQFITKFTPFSSSFLKSKLQQYYSVHSSLPPNLLRSSSFHPSL